MEVELSFLHPQAYDNAVAFFNQHGYSTPCRPPRLGAFGPVLVDGSIQLLGSYQFEILCSLSDESRVRELYLQWNEERSRQSRHSA